MNVVEVIAKALSCNLVVNVTKNKITRSSNANLARNMSRKDELAIIPANLNLQHVSYWSSSYMLSNLTYSLPMEVDVVAFSIAHKVLSGCTVYERDTSSLVIGTEENIEECTTSNHTDDVFMSSSIREVG